MQTSSLQVTTKATGNITREAVTKMHTYWPTGELNMLVSPKPELINILQSWHMISKLKDTIKRSCI